MDIVITIQEFWRTGIWTVNISFATVKMEGRKPDKLILTLPVSVLQQFLPRQPQASQSYILVSPTQYKIAAPQIMV